MADVKTLTVHGIPYSIKDETARNNISTLQSTVSGHTGSISSINGEIDTIQSTVSGHTGSIGELESNVDGVKENMYAPNVLVNGDFKVTQRDTGPFTFNNSSAGYTADMWYIYHGNGVSVTKSDNGIFVNNMSGTSNCYFVQKILNTHKSGVHSFRINVTNVVGDIMFYFRNKTASAYHITEPGEHVFKLTAVNSDSVLFELPAGSSIEIKYVYMCAGDFAYKYIEEDPSFAFERCARYFYRIKFSGANTTPIGIGYARTDSGVNDARFVCYLPFEMITRPTVTLNGVINYETNTLAYGTITEISQYQTSNLTASITGKTTGLTSGSMFTAYISDENRTSYLDFSCEPEAN